MTSDERRASSRLWVHLTGATADTRLEAIASVEALTVGELLVTLNAPAMTFVNWFRRQHWELFAMTEATGDDSWADDVLARSRATCAVLGALASQVPMRLPYAV